MHEFDTATLRTFLEAKGLRFRTSGQAELIIETCPFCHDTGGKRDNHNKLYINESNGLFKCHRCNAKGNFDQFCELIGEPLTQNQAKATSSRTQTKQTDKNEK